MQPARSIHRDRGFTLPEVLVSMVVMGTIAAVMVTVFAVVYRTSPTTEARAEDARSVLGLVTWTEKIGTTTTTYMASYRHVSSGANARVIRVSCSGVGSPPFTGTKVNLTSELPPLPPGWTEGNYPARVTIDRDAAGEVDLVTFELVTIDGDIVKTDSASKNPADTLPTTTLPSWAPPTPSTIATVNQLPTAAPVAATAHPGAVRTVNLASLIADANGDTLVLSRDLPTEPAGWSIGLSSTILTFTPPAATPVGTVQAINYLVDDQQGDGVVTGTVTVTVVAATSPTSTSTSTTTTTTLPATTTTAVPPCSVTGAAATPSSVRNVPSEGGNGNVNVGVLKDAVTITATTNAECTGLEIRYKSGGVNTPPFIAMSRTGPTTWSYTLPSKNEGSSETWSDGPKLISFYSTSGGPHGPGATLTVT